MSQFIRAVQLPDKNSIRIELIARIVALSRGVGIYNERNRMIGWIETGSDEQTVHVADLLNDIVNNPRRATQPDWGFIHAVDESVGAQGNSSTVVSARDVAAVHVSAVAPVTAATHAPAETPVSSRAGRSSS